jgi:phage gp29-like protein
MSEEKIAPPNPTEIVNDAVLSQQPTAFQNATVYSGNRSPAELWLMMVSDSPEAIRLYRELEEKDSDVGGALEELKLSVLKRDRKVLAADKTPEAENLANEVQHMLDGLPNFHQVLSSLLDAPGYGFSIIELIYEVQPDGSVVIQDARECPQEMFLFGPRIYPQIGPLRFCATLADANGVLVPEEKFLIMTYQPRARNRKGQPLFRKVFWDSWFKRQMQRFWLHFAERGPGTAVTRYRDGATAEDKNKALAAAEGLISQTAMAVNESMEFEVELLKIARAQDPSVYEKLMAKLEMRIWRRINGQTLTSHGGEDGKGTQALGKVHEDVQNTRAVELCLALESVVNDQLVKRYVLWNYGPDAPMPRWEMDKTVPEDQADLVTRDKTLQDMGFQFTERYVRDTYQIAPPEPDDVLLKPAPASAPAISSPAGTPLRPLFAEPSQPGVDEKQFDALFGNLKDDVTAILRDRANEVARHTI